MARILIIDDDAALLDVLCMAMEDEGHTVLVASDGRAGLERIRSERPDLVVSDVNMPRLDGFSLCKELRAQLLECVGYRAKVFEFISTEHTAKNLLIAAHREHAADDPAFAGQRARLIGRARSFAAFYGIREQRLARHLGIDLGA